MADAQLLVKIRAPFAEPVVLRVGTQLKDILELSVPMLNSHAARLDCPVAPLLVLGELSSCKSPEVRTDAPQTIHSIKVVTQHRINMRLVLLDRNQEMVQPAHSKHISHIMTTSRNRTVYHADTVWQHDCFHLESMASNVPLIQCSLHPMVLLPTRCSYIIAIRPREWAVNTIDGAVYEPKNIIWKEA